MLELRSVTYRYAGASRVALESVDLSVEDGEIVGLVGPNEAGKTTTCLVASGFAPASIGGELRGDVRLDGASLVARAPWELAGRTGLVAADVAAQRSGITETVLEEVALGPVNLGLSVAETLERARWAMTSLGIEDLAERDPAHLSGGQARLLAIASILAMRPRLLVLDEPVGELDAGGRSRVAKLLREVAAEGTSVLVAEHDRAFLGALGARVVSVHEGRVTA